MADTQPEAGLFDALQTGSERAWRGRACWASIDLDAIEANCRTIRAGLRGGAGLMAVVKANGYGHGIVGIARAALDGGATWFGVAAVEEGAQLRSAGVDAPILVLGYVPHWEAERVLRLDLAVAVTTRQLALALSRAAADLGRPATVHVKVDTGMGRYGVLPEEALEFVRACQATPGLNVDGVFTHLATADEPDRTHAERQLRRFDALCAVLAAHGALPPVRHAVNSAGTFAFPDHAYDMVRCGIAVFGVPPADMAGLPRLRPALALKARIARLRTLPAGSCVGYGCTFVAARPTDVALIPIGYADGVSRALSNRGWALANGRRAPFVGRVSMDQLTIDVTGLGPLHQDDEVTLIGRQGDEEITATDVAAWRDTIAYEVLTQLHVRVPRVYLRCGQAVGVAENGDFWALPDRPER